MARKKRRRRKASLMTKAINAGVLALGLSYFIDAFMVSKKSVAHVVDDITGGLTQGAGASFDFNRALQVYGPMVAAIVLKKGISMVRRHARV